jgi:hypothetical protein
MAPHDRGPGVHRWKFALVTTVGLGAALLLGGGIASGQLPMNIALSGQPFIGSVSAVDATGIEVYPRAVGTDAGDLPSVAVKIDQARLSDVCLSTVARGLPLIGDVTFLARVPGTSLSADSLLIDVASVEGSVTVADVQLGLAANALGEVTGSRTAAVAVGNTVAGPTRFDIITLTAEGATIEGLRVNAERGDASC